MFFYNSSHNYPTIQTLLVLRGLTLLIVVRIELGWLQMQPKYEPTHQPLANLYVEREEIVIL